MKSLRAVGFSVIVVLLTVTSSSIAVGQQGDGAEVTDARAQAEAIIKEAQEKALQIERDAMRKAVEIESDAMRKAAQIEADAIRKAAQTGAQAQPAPTPSIAGTTSVAGDRYPDINGVWSWKGNSRNRKFELKYTPDGAVVADLYRTPRARHYREDLRYENGVLKGNTYLTIDTATRNSKKRYRYFQLEISRDGKSLEGYVQEWEEQGRKDDQEEVVWERVGK